MINNNVNPLTINEQTGEVFFGTDAGLISYRGDATTTQTGDENSNVKIFLAKIPPLGKQWADKKLCDDSTSYDQAIRNLNTAFVVFAKKRTEKLSPVIIVDQYSGINTDIEMYDDIHPNEIGEKRMAEKWYNAIRKYLNKLH